MTTDIENRVRTGLQRWADDVSPAPGDALDAMDRRPVPTDRPAIRRTRAVLAAAAAAALLAAGVSQFRHPDQPPPAGEVPAAPATTAAPAHLGELPTVVLAPADARWRLTRFGLLRFTDRSSVTAYGYQHADGRTVELHFLPVTDGVPPFPPATGDDVTVRGLPGRVATDEQGRRKLRWDEAGRSWIAEGTGFAGVEDLVALVDGVAILDDTTWRTRMPPDVVTALDGHPNESLGWAEGSPVGTEAPIDAPQLFAAGLPAWEEFRLFHLSTGPKASGGPS
jgi:hypothetical protein